MGAPFDADKTLGTAMPCALPEPAPALLAFLDEIGIAWELAALEQPTVLPGLSIAYGRLLVDPERLQYPGDILHEAGHIAVTAAADRPGLDPSGLENPGLEIAALAWSYAAALRLGIPAETVFHSGGYKGDGAWLVETFRSGGTLGQPLLAWMGLTRTGPGVDPAHVFPAMIQWLRD